MTDPAEGRALLELARAALEEALAVAAPKEVAGAPSAPGACFVTLTKGGELRGCIGSLEANRPLAEDVRANAVAAALRDPRFPPLAAGELPEVSIEISVLSPPEPMRFASEADLLRQLRPGRDGVVLIHGARRGVFLPAVWRHLPGPRRFLAQLKVKTGLAPDFWSPDLRAERFETTTFREAVAVGEPTRP